MKKLQAAHGMFHPMTLQETLTTLESLADEKVKKRNLKNGSSPDTYGVKLGDIKKLAKKIKTNSALADELWQTSNTDAMLLASLLIDPKTLPSEKLQQMVQTATFPQLADWLNNYIVKNHPQKEELRQKWMQSTDKMIARTAWSLTWEAVSKNPEKLDLPTLLNRIENEMTDAPQEAQWTMNFTLIEIGTNFPEHREQAIAIGEKIGAFRDYPTSKGCVSPYAPIAIKELSSTNRKMQ